MTTSNRSALTKVKAFGMSSQMLLAELTQLSKQLGIDLGHIPTSDNAIEDAYVPQFSSAVRIEAARMARHYELFYCLERTVRAMVDESLTDAKQTTYWWSTDCVPSHIKAEVHTRIKNEVDTGITRRSDDELDYTTFGELSVIITSNWEVFGGPLNSKRAVEKVMASLNSLRNPIAHCCPLAEDEEVRLSLALKDWFRLME